MSVTNGQAVDAPVTNAAFLSRKTDSDTIAKIDLKKPTGSGAFITDVQKVMNNFIQVMGMLTQDNTSLVYDAVNVADGVSLKVAVKSLDDAIVALGGSLNDILASNNIWTGDNTFQGAMNLDADVDSSSTGDDVVLPLFNKSVLRLTNSGLNSIAGITAPDPATAKLLILQNGTAAPITVQNYGPAVNPADQIVSPSLSDISLQPGASMLLYYNVASQFWGVLGGSGGSSGGGGGTPILWGASEFDGAVLSQFSGVPAYVFPQGSDGSIIGTVKVPSGFGTGLRPTIRLYSECNSFDNYRLKVTSWLVKPTIQRLDDITYEYSEETNDIGSAGDVVLNPELNIADADGEIGGGVIQGDDVIRFKIERVVPGGTEATQDVFLFHGLISINWSP